MATNSGDLTQTLIEGGLAPQAARAIANAIANAHSGTFSRGRDVSDATPTDQLRMITADTRRYQLTNLDFSPAAPFQDRLSSNPGEYAGPAPDHPYKDSQPLVSAPPLSSPRVEGSDYIAVSDEVTGNSAVSRIGLRLRQQTGRHLRIDPSTKFLDALPFLASSQSGSFLSAEFQETEEGTQLVVSLRNLEKVTAMLANGDTREVFVFPEAAAAGPDGDAAGGSRSLDAMTVQLSNGQIREIYALPKGSATNPTGGAVAAHCRAWAVFDGATAGTNPVNCTLIGSSNITSVTRTAGGSFSVTMTNAMPNTNYMVLLTASHFDPTGGNNDQVFAVLHHLTTFSTTQFHIAVYRRVDGAAANASRINIAVFS